MEIDLYKQKKLSRLLLVDRTILTYFQLGKGGLLMKWHIFCLAQLRIRRGRNNIESGALAIDRNYF